MSSEVDYYDVQAMIRDARSEIRADIENAVRGLRGDLWADVQAELYELREALASTNRVLASRTEHLA